jgi:hypothetical protein
MIIIIIIITNSQEEQEMHINFWEEAIKMYLKQVEGHSYFRKGQENLDC